MRCQATVTRLLSLDFTVRAPRLHSVSPATTVCTAPAQEVAPTPDWEVVGFVTCGVVTRGVVPGAVRPGTGSVLPEKSGSAGVSRALGIFTRAWNGSRGAWVGTAAAAAAAAGEGAAANGAGAAVAT